MLGHLIGSMKDDDRTGAGGDDHPPVDKPIRHHPTKYRLGISAPAT